MDEYEKKIQLAEEAKRLLAPGSLFNTILSVLTREAIDELIQADVGGLTATAVHARMKALNDIKGRLKVVENDATMAKHKGKPHG